MNAMRVLVDGHNLIPKLPGGSLTEIDDEQRLLEWLQPYQRQRRNTLEVFFDGAPAGQAGTRTLLGIRVHFVRAGKTADDAICDRLRALGTQAVDVMVVSSDRQVRAEARARRAKSVTSEEFARELIQLRHNAPRPTEPGPAMNDAELEEWLRLFGGGK